MRAPVPRCVVCVACVVVAVVAATVAPAGAAGASGVLVQTGAARGVVVAGEEFTGAVGVGGAASQVTFTQTDGAPAVVVSSNGVVASAAGLAAGTYTANGTMADKNRNAGTWSFTVEVLAPAPVGFTDTASRVYGSIYRFNGRHGQAGALQPPAEYRQAVASMPRLGLALFHRSVSRTPRWLQIPSIMQSMTATAPRTAAALLGPEAAVAASSLEAPEEYDPDGTGGNYNGNCGGVDNGESIVFGLQIVLDAASLAYNEAMIFVAGLEEMLPPGVAALIIAGNANAVLTAAQVAHDTVEYLAAKADSCEQADLMGYAAHLDKTTVQTYSLLADAVDAVAEVQATATTTDSHVQGVATQLAATQASLSGSIAQSMKAMQSSIGGNGQAALDKLQMLQDQLAKMLAGNATKADVDLIRSGLQALWDSLPQRFNDVHDLLDGLDSSVNTGQNDLRRGMRDQLTRQIERMLLSPVWAAPPRFWSPGPDGILTAPNDWGVSVAEIVLSQTDCSEGEQGLADEDWQAAFAALRTCFQAAADFTS